MNVHFIAIGGSVMHNLALCLRLKNYNVSGSDDEIFEPAASNLAQHGLLPEKTGWFPEKITSSLDAVILGMHAKDDNPELLKAKELGIPIYSFPAYVYEQIKNKKRVVVAGSHGKTTITSMILHALKHLGKDFDYLVGSRIQDFDMMVSLTDKAPIAVLEGDEYLSSSQEKISKFLFYKPHVAVISGIAWDHVNVFPTFEEYVDQFRQFIATIEKGGALIYNAEDAIVKRLADEADKGLKKIPYSTPRYEIENNKTTLHFDKVEYPLKIFGRHNLQNLEAARLACNQVGIPNELFIKAMQPFTGAAKRLETVFKNDSTALFKDFAHSPSKLKATISAVKEQFPERKLAACMELHTYSSLNPTFLQEYKGCMDEADVPIVYYNQHTLQLKRLPELSPEQVKTAFQNEHLLIFTERDKLVEYLQSLDWKNVNLLMMSSGNFDGLDWEKITPKSPGGDLNT